MEGFGTPTFLTQEQALCALPKKLLAQDELIWSYMKADPREMGGTKALAEDGTQDDAEG